MKKITKYPKTKKEFHDYHILLWTEIMVLLIENGAEKYEDGINLKKCAFKSLFYFGYKHVIGYCFGCAWKIQQPCLFRFHCDRNGDVDGLCLKRYWDKFRFNIDTNDTPAALKHALLIRNFPVRK